MFEPHRHAVGLQMCTEIKLHVCYDTAVSVSVEVCHRFKKDSLNDAQLYLTSMCSLQ